jgi:predicted N-acyltransferase
MDMGPTLSLDLTIPPEEQYSSFRRSHKVNIQRLRGSGVVCEEAGAGGAGVFAEIYHETMDRCQADERYYLPVTYFEQLLGSMPNEAHLFLCWDDGKAISGMIALSRNGIIQGHLGGTLTDYQDRAPMKLAYDTVRLWGIQRGAHTFHIGGGVNGRRDTLFAHKQGFSKREHIFHNWGYTVDEKVCDELHRCMCRRTELMPDDPYFPPYRHPALTGDCVSDARQGE